ncbi:MAG: PorT family protein [Bacteroidales bacterium]|nr:PorT family protein [Bacteroidales bacterium]
MKSNRLIVSILLLLSAFTAMSQRFNGGLIIGGCASHLTGSLVDSTSTIGTKFFSKPGLNAGVFTDIYFDDKSSLGFEISYIQKGSRKVPGPNDTIPGQVYEAKTALHYITIPVHYSYTFNERFSAFTGPNIGLLLRKLCKIEQNYIDFTADYIDQFSSFDFSWDFGVNIKLLYRLSLDIKFSSTFFLTPVRSYHNPEGWKFGPFAKQFWVKGQYNQLVDFTFRWTLWGSQNQARW